jgi:hypothetical protein
MVAMGNTHDFRLFKQSKLPLKKDTLVYVDTGYLGMKKLHQNIEKYKAKSSFKRR